MTECSVPPTGVEDVAPVCRLSRQVLAAETGYERLAPIPADMELALPATTDTIRAYLC